MGYIVGTDRGQASLLPARIEDYVAGDAPVRGSTRSSTGSTWRRWGSGGQRLPRPAGRAMIRAIS
jgi:hypothetical protein